MAIKKRVTITVTCLLVGGVTAISPAPAQAFDIGGLVGNFFGNILDVVSLDIGNFVGDKIGGYLEIGFGELDKILGVDPGTVSGVTGYLDPLLANNAIATLVEDESLLSDLDLNVTAEGSIRQGFFSGNYTNAIGSSVLTKESQDAFKQSTDGVNQTVEDAADAAKKAQDLNVTQDIQKVEVSQNAQNIAIQGVISQKQDMQIKQQAGTNLAVSQSAIHDTKDEARINNESTDDANSTTIGSGMMNGVVGGI